MKFSLSLLFLTASLTAFAQGAIEWTVNINTQQITQTDAKIFQTLEKDLVTFLNQPIWSEDVFEEEERIQASIFLTIREVEVENNSGTEVSNEEFKATLAVQSSRPVYGTDDLTPVLNTQDPNIDFTYQQFDPIVYTEQGQSSSLANIMAFYAYVILALDYDTFSPRGGEEYFKKALELTQRLSDAERRSRGWTENGKRNRSNFIREVTDPRMLPMRRAYYAYHRTGLDLMHDDIATARGNISVAIDDAARAAKAYLGSTYAQAFMDAKREEIIEIYKGASGPEQNAVIQTMSQMDPSKANVYRSIRTGRSVGNRSSRSQNLRSASRPSVRQ